MPDLNLRSPDVTAALDDVARFWLQDVGVDGFRLDAAKHLIEDGKDAQMNTPETKAWLAGWKDRLDAVAPDAMTVGEVWDPATVAASYVPDSTDLTFDFGFATAIRLALQNGRAAPLGHGARRHARRVAGEPERDVPDEPRPAADHDRARRRRGVGEARGVPPAGRARDAVPVLRRGDRPHRHQARRADPDADAVDRRRTGRRVHHRHALGAAPGRLGDRQRRGPGGRPRRACCPRTATSSGSAAPPRPCSTARPWRSTAAPSPSPAGCGPPTARRSSPSRTSRTSR